MNGITTTQKNSISNTYFEIIKKWWKYFVIIGICFGAISLIGINILSALVFIIEYNSNGVIEFIFGMIVINIIWIVWVIISMGLATLIGTSVIYGMYTYVNDDKNDYSLKGFREIYFACLRKIR